MKFILQYSLKRAWRVRPKLLLMASFLSLGFWGWLMSESSQTSIKKHLESNAQNILSADLTVSVRRELTEQEKNILLNETKGLGQLAKGYELFAMMTAGSESRLVLVRAIENSYPFYGQLELENASKTPQLQGKNLWAYSEFKAMHGLKKGDVVTLGDAKFNVTDFVLEDQTQTFRLASLAPRVFIHIEDLKDTNLIQFGSTFTSTYFFKAHENTEINVLTQVLKTKLEDPAIDIVSFRTLPEEGSSPTQRLSDFLGLTSLVALLFSALSLFYLLQIWSLEQQKERALLASFGLSKSLLYIAEVLQSLFVALLSTIFSTALMLGTRPFIERLLLHWTQQNFHMDLGWKDVLLILLSQFVLLIVISNPLTKSKQASLSQLIKNNFILEQAGVVKFIPLFVLVWPYAIFASRSFRNGSYFFFSLFFISVSLILIGRGLIKILSNLPFRSWKTVLAVKSLKRQSTASWAFIFTVGLSSALLNLIPQIQSSIEGMMRMDQIQNRPSLFLFDIQSEQWPEVQDMFRQLDVTPTAASPLIRGRILKINDEPFERAQPTSLFRTRENESEERIRNRGISLTYRPQLQTGETIVKGEDIPMVFDPAQKHPYVSLERRYADRLNVDIGDFITFDVQGIEITAQVKNLRQVTWSRFEPNFFILFQDGVLNDAPQTYLASLRHMDSSRKALTMKTLSQTFSNISIIDVERLMTDIIRNLEKISGALKLMTYLTLLTGMMTIVFLLTAESRRRAFEVHLLKVLGAEDKPVLKSRLQEVFILGSISLLVGISSSFLIAAVIVDQVFQVPVILNFWPTALITASVLGLSWCVSVVTTKKAYKENSFAFLKEEE